MSGADDPALTIGGFESGHIDAAAFDHEAHVYVAWLYIGRYGRDVGTARFTAAMRRLTVSLGVPEKFHATVTGFYLQLIAERAAADPAADWRSFRETNADLFRQAKRLLARHYSDELIGSARARREFVSPDRARAERAD